MDTTSNPSITKHIITIDKQLQKTIRKRRNYIPFSTPHNPDFGKWRFAYHVQLENMYKIAIDIIQNKHPQKLDWESPVIQNLFANLIYNNSSKHISKYI